MSSPSTDVDRAAGPAPPEVLAVAEQRAAVVAVAVPRADMPSVVRPAVIALRETLRGQGLAPSGPLFIHHLRLDDALFDIEIGFPIAGTIVPVGRVSPGRLPSATVVRTVHRGGYDGLAAAWGALRRWMDEHGHVRASDLWEVYLLGPETRPDPADWRTELSQPILRDRIGGR